MPVTTKDNGYDKLIATINAAKNLSVTLGIHAEEGAAQGEGGRTVAQNAEDLEFGTSNQVPRPAITAFGDRMATEAPRAIRDRYAAALKAGKNPAQAIDQLAQVWAGEIQAATASTAPNKQSTMDRKGSTVPWVDTGQTKAAIRGKVVAGK